MDSWTMYSAFSFFFEETLGEEKPHKYRSVALLKNFMGQELQGATVNP